MVNLNFRYLGIISICKQGLILHSIIPFGLKGSEFISIHQLFSMVITSAQEICFNANSLIDIQQHRQRIVNYSLTFARTHKVQLFILRSTLVTYSLLELITASMHALKFHAHTSQLDNTKPLLQQQPNIEHYTHHSSLFPIDLR